MGGPLLTSSQLQILCQQKYECKVHGRSLLLPVLEPIWRFIAHQLPLRIAPGFSTLISSFIAVGCCLIATWQSPQGSHSAEIPSWALLVAAFGILFYQITNAICGRQNISLLRTSPIDQVIDCCCASVFNFVMCLSTAYAVGIVDYGGYMITFMFVGFVVFHLRHWETYVNGKVLIGKIHTPEVQLITMLVHLITAAYGSSFWSYEVAHLHYFGQIRMWQCWHFITMLSAIQFCRTRFATILGGGVGKNGSSIAGTSVLSPGIPVALTILFALYIYKHSQYQIFQKEPIISFLMFCPCLAKITGKLQISLITKHPVDMTDNIMFGPFALVLISYFSLSVDESFTLYACLVYCWLNLITYTTKLCMEISQHLKINIFTVLEKTD